MKLIAVSDNLYMFVGDKEKPPYEKQKCLVYDTLAGKVRMQPMPVGSWTARVFPWREPTKEELAQDWSFVK